MAILEDLSLPTCTEDRDFFKFYLLQRALEALLIVLPRDSTHYMLLLMMDLSFFVGHSFGFGCFTASPAANVGYAPACVTQHKGFFLKGRYVRPNQSSSTLCLASGSHNFVPWGFTPHL